MYSNLWKHERDIITMIISITFTITFISICFAQEHFNFLYENETMIVPTTKTSSCEKSQ